MELAKVSKLLLLFDKGKVTPGTNFNEIDTNICDVSSIDGRSGDEENIGDMEVCKKQSVRTSKKRNLTDESRLKLPVVFKVLNENNVSTIEERSDEEENSKDEDYKRQPAKKIKKRNMSEESSLKYTSGEESGEVVTRSKVKNLKAKRRSKRNQMKNRELWLTEENEAIQSILMRDILLGLVPNKSDCDRCKEQQICQIGHGFK